MKTSREQLKALVKELMIEALTEGLGAGLQQARTMPIRSASPERVSERRAPVNNRQRLAFDPRLDTPIQGRTPSDALKETIKRESGGNPVMADILADTAMTTLPSQLSHGDSMGGSSGISRDHLSTQQEQFHGDPAEVFGEAAQMRDDGSSHWADLAFMTPGKKSA